MALEPARLGTASVRDNDITPRINTVACILFIIVGLGVAYTLSFGPVRLHQSNSMHLVEGIGLPWKGWGLIYLVYALLLTNKRSRVGGYFLGFILYGFYLTSYGISVSHGNPGSAPGVAAGILAVISQGSGWTRSMLMAEWR